MSFYYKSTDINLPINPRISKCLLKNILSNNHGQIHVKLCVMIFTCCGYLKNYTFNIRSVVVSNTENSFKQTTASIMSL